MFKDLEKMKELYDDGINIIDYIKSNSDLKGNTTEMIKVSYDLQAGSYIQKVAENPMWENKYADAFARTFDQLGPCNSILEVGVGEATTLNNTLSRTSNVYPNVFGFDISYSRVKYAMDYLRRNNAGDVTLFVGDMFSSAIQDNSIDIVYTSHSLEPNGGREKEALSELYRITNKHLVLFEPGYEFANNETKKYIQKHGYVQDLYSTAVDLGYKVIEHKLLFKEHPNSINNTAVIIIEKDPSKNPIALSPLACPVTKAPVELICDNYYCRESLLLYPVVNQIPCLLPENAIIATHYLDKL